MGKQRDLVPLPVGMPAQDRAMLDAIVRETYQKHQAAKVAGMVDYVIRRGPDIVIRKWDVKLNRPTRFKHAGKSWREVGLAMYGEDFAERLAVRLDSMHAQRVR